MNEHTHNSTVAISRASQAQTFSNFPVFLETFFRIIAASTFVSLVFEPLPELQQLPIDDFVSENVWLAGKIYLFRCTICFITLSDDQPKSSFCVLGADHLQMNEESIHPNSEPVTYMVIAGIAL